MEERNYKLYVHISPSNKRYYGITSYERVEYRWLNGEGYKYNKHFYNAINKYGWENFQHLVVFDNLTKDEACLLEQIYIALYDTMNPKYGYNRTSGGEHCTFSEQSRKKISESKMGENNPMYGKHLTEEHKRKIGQATKGRKHTEETKRKLSESHKGSIPWNKGTHLSEELREKISNGNKGKKISEETRKKLSNALKGRKLSEETKRKMRENNGTKRPEVRKKISETNKIVQNKPEVREKRCKSLKKAWETMDEEKRNRSIKMVENNPMYNEDIKNKHLEKVQSQEYKENMSKASKKMWANMSEEKIMERNKKISEALKGMNTKKVKCIETGVIYNSILEAQTAMGNPNGRGIYEAVNKENRTSCGFHWCYVENLDNYIAKNSRETKKVKCIELDLIFDSTADANEYLGKPRKHDNIGSCARGKHPTAWGYHWEYITEEQEKQAI